jgi:hypothetical protein
VPRLVRIGLRRHTPRADRRPGAARLKLAFMIRKLPSGGYRLYSRKTDPKTGKHRNLGTFKTLEEAQQHERAVQYFKRRG